MSSDRERTWIGRVESPAWRTGWAIVAQVREEAGGAPAAQGGQSTEGNRSTEGRRGRQAV